MISQHIKQSLYRIAYVDNDADHYEIDPFFGDHAFIILSAEEKQKLGVKFDACIIFKDTLHVDPVHLHNH